MNSELSFWCQRCGNRFKSEEKYCTYCGTMRTVGIYEPRKEVNAMVYGPPYSAKYTCEECNVTFIVRGLGRAGNRYCPNCGKLCDCEQWKD